jgi:hypothetical protein
VKTTIDLPDPTFRRAKALAATQGVTLKSFITEAVERSLQQPRKSVTELVDSLPRVGRKTIEAINRRVAEMDADDLRFQTEATEKNAP